MAIIFAINSSQVAGDVLIGGGLAPYRSHKPTSPTTTLEIRQYLRGRYQFKKFVC